MRILITGVHGFMGSNLVESLSKVHTIFGLDIVSPATSGVERTYSWDDLEQGNVPVPDAIIHLAGKAHDVQNKAVAEEYFMVNTTLATRIYDYFIAHPEVKKFIFFSSVKAVAHVVDGDVLTEDVEYRPVGPYGESKAAAEKYMLAHLINDRETIILRPCMTHGPRNKGNLNRLYRILSKGIPSPLGAFDNRRTFTSIENMKFIISRLLECKVESGVYNVADDDAISINALVEEMCLAMGRKPRIWRIPRALVKAVAKIGDFIHLPLNTDRLEKLTENYVASNAKIKRALGIDSLPVKAQDGIRHTVESFSKKP